jgi:hypothetical protein
MTALAIAVAVAGFMSIQVVGAWFARRRAAHRLAHMNELMRLLRETGTISNLPVPGDESAAQNRALAIFDATFADVFGRAYFWLKDIDSAEEVAVETYLAFFDASAKPMRVVELEPDEARRRLVAMTTSRVRTRMDAQHASVAGIEEIQQIKTTVLGRVSDQLQIVGR